MEREQTTLRLPPELMERLRKQAREMGISVNAVEITCLELGLKEDATHESQTANRKARQVLEQCIRPNVL